MVPVSAQRAKTWEAAADVVVLGSGVAGLTTALTAVQLGLRVLVVTKGAVDDSNTRWAQGGVAVVRSDECDPGDSVDRHVADTLAAGAGLCDPDAVAAVVGGGPGAIARLRARGAQFDRGADGTLARTREGGHTAFRVIHAGGDATGAEVERALVASSSGLAVLEHHIAVDAALMADGSLGGVHVMAPDGSLGLVRAPAVVLATGGVGQLYAASTNPSIATGDGLALALRAGAEVTDLEFVQFHPTALFAPGGGGRRPLVTEAVRGEGATLTDGAGRPVMAGVHPLGDLAPRDVVSAAITRRLASSPGGVDDHVFLDARSIVDFSRRFPTVYASCAQIGIDPGQEPIPVTPAAHFACGGVRTDTHGRTSVLGLYAVGEVARTGLHGANRLASNSLLEGLVVGERTAHAVAADAAVGELTARAGELALGVAGRRRYAVDRTVVQRTMSRHAAIGRDADGLAAATAVLTGGLRTRELRTTGDVEDAALSLVALAMVTAAAERTESRGAHVRSDHPATDDAWQRSVVIRLDADGLPAVLTPACAGNAA